MNEQDMLNIIIPTAAISGNGVNSIASFQIEKVGDVWYMAGKANGPNGDVSDRILLEPEDIIDVLDGTLDVDQYCQDEAFRQHMEELANRLGGKITESTTRSTFNITIGPYMRQQHVSRSQGVNFLDILMKESIPNDSMTAIPDHLKVREPDGYIPDQSVLSGALQRIYEGQPCTAILGPTGSGKSAMARYIGAQLNGQGYGIHIIDAHSRLEGDRLYTLPGMISLLIR